MILRGLDADMERERGAFKDYRAEPGLSGVLHSRAPWLSLKLGCRQSDCAAKLDAHQNCLQIIQSADKAYNFMAQEIGR